jgi:SIR2-like domain
LDAELLASLLASMEAGRLVAVCGAGLSMAPPSSLPSAKAVAQACFDEYAVAANPQFDHALRDDLERLAQHFADSGTLETVFIGRLVPWNEFVRPSNPGHPALADFLITHALASALSTNYDCLIERRAWDYGAHFSSSLDGDEATAGAVAQSPLLKFHGCSVRDPKATLWTKSQLDDPLIAGRIAKSRIWMAANLREKDLLIVGFWSDWAYLNEILGKALLDVSPLSITVVDKAPAEELEAKAPDLWALAHAEHVRFRHVQESAADVLDELRRAFSRAYLRKVLHAGKAALEEQIDGSCDPAWFDVADNDSETLYGLRRDAEGVPSGLPAKLKAPGSCEVLGLFHLLLRRAGAVSTAQGYALRGKTIRVINGANSVLSRLQARFLEAPSIPRADVIAAIGAEDFGLPGNIVRQGRVGDIMRPAAGGRWLDLKGARELLQV